MIAVFDSTHSEHEDRWATIGIDRNGIQSILSSSWMPTVAELELFLPVKQPEKNQNGIRRKKMKKEYDFSKGERGKFYRPDVELYLPIYIEPD